MVMVCASSVHGLGLLGYCLVRLTQWVHGVKHFSRMKPRKFPHWVQCPSGHGTALHPRTQWVRVSGAIRATIEKLGFLVSHWVNVPAEVGRGDKKSFPATP